MTTKEAIGKIESLIDHVVCDTIAVRYTTPAKEALAVLRAVCEDYEKARPLLEKFDKMADAACRLSEADMAEHIVAIIKLTHNYRAAKERT